MMMCRLTRIAAIALMPTLSLGPAAIAQTASPTPAQAPPANGVFTAAPVPSVVPERIAPADRAGSAPSSLSTGDTPFSAAPSGANSGSVSPALRDLTPNSGPSTPSLSK